MATPGAQQEVSKVVVQIEEVSFSSVNLANRLTLTLMQTRKRRIKAFIRADLVCAKRLH